MGLPWWVSVKNLPACQWRRHGFDLWVRKIPWSRKWLHIPVFSTRKSHGQRSLAGYSPRGSKESSKTEHSFCMKVKELVAQPCPSLCNPMDWGLPARFLCPGDFPGKNASLRAWNSPGKNTGVGSHCFLQGNLSDPGIEPRSPALQADSLPSEPPGKPFCMFVKGKCLIPSLSLALDSLHTTSPASSWRSSAFWPGNGNYMTQNSLRRRQCSLLAQEHGVSVWAQRVGAGPPNSVSRRPLTAPACAWSRTLGWDGGDAVEEVREEVLSPLRRGGPEVRRLPACLAPGPGARPRRGHPSASRALRPPAPGSPMAAAALRDPPQVSARPPGPHRPQPTGH